MDVNDVVELTLETDDPEGLERFYCTAFGPAGNVVEVWDFFERGKGAPEGADGLPA